MELLTFEELNLSINDIRKINGEEIIISDEMVYEKISNLISLHKITKNQKEKVFKLLKRYRNRGYFDDINGDKKLTLANESSYIIFNIEYKRFQFQLKKSITSYLLYKDYHINDIKAYELMFDNEVYTSNQRGLIKTISGGLLFGGVGLIAGAIGENTKKTEKVVKEYYMKLYLDDFDLPYVEIPCKNRENAFLLLETFKMWEEKANNDLNLNEE